VSWSASGGTTRVQIKRNGVVVLDGAPLHSAVQDCLDESGRVTYRVEASNSAGETVFREETITVEEAPPPSPVLIIHSFAASADEIALGECVMLSWKYEGTQLSSVRLMRGEEVILTDPPNEGNHQDCPPAVGQVIYQLILDAEDGTSVQKGYIVNVSPVGHTWRLTSYYDGQAMVSVLGGTGVTLVVADGNLDGFAGCNTYNATYQVNGNSLTVGPAVVTGQSCTEPEGIMEQETAFLAALESAATYQVKGSQLIVKNASGQQVLTFKLEPEISPY
jgi:heat shock protein HslJ